MQNLKPTHFSAVADHPSAVGDVLDRVVTIAPAPLLPGEKQADYAEVALRIVRAAKPRDAIEEFLIRDVIDLTWDILRWRRIESGIFEGVDRADGVREILYSLGTAIGDIHLDEDASRRSGRRGKDSTRRKSPMR